MAVIANPIAVIATLASEKLRSLNRPSGRSGSFLFQDWYQTKMPSRTRPAPIDASTVADQS